MNEFTEHKLTQPTQTTKSGPAVNSTVGNNEIAGGVDITKMAVAPIGYADYLNLTMRDNTFYMVRFKEPYKQVMAKTNSNIITVNWHNYDITNYYKSNGIINQSDANIPSPFKVGDYNCSSIRFSELGVDKWYWNGTDDNGNDIFTGVSIPRELRR